MAQSSIGPNRPSGRAVHCADQFLPAVARAVLPHLPALCARWLSGGRRIGREWTCGSLRGEPGASCKVNLATNHWADFATGQRFSDAVSLASAIFGLSQADAGRRPAAMLRHASHLTGWEQQFLHDITRRWPLLPKQAGVLDRIVFQLRQEGAA